MKILSPVLYGAVPRGRCKLIRRGARCFIHLTIPKILQITIEYPKPYKGGAAHDKTESAFVLAQAKAKFPVYYVAMNSMSGRSRALYHGPLRLVRGVGKGQQDAGRQSHSLR